MIYFSKKIKNLMKIKINNKLSFNSEGRTLIIAEVSANHCGSKQKFLQHQICKKKWRRFNKNTNV